MNKRDRRIDAYIARSAEFAKPILTHFRELVHKAAPDIEETMKWSFPHFVQKGTVCSMAAFKEHCAIGFWKAKLIFGGKSNEEAMGHFGRITKLSDLPSDKTLTSHIKEAVRLNEEGIKVPSQTKPRERKDLIVPPYFTAALRQNKKALATFENYSYSHRKEYVEWITEAKREETREKRIKTAILWLAQGKSRNWKYEKC